MISGMIVGICPCLKYKIKKKTIYELILDHLLVRRLHKTCWIAVEVIYRSDRARRLRWHSWGERESPSRSVEDSSGRHSRGRAPVFSLMLSQGQRLPGDLLNRLRQSSGTGEEGPPLRSPEGPDRKRLGFRVYILSYAFHIISDLI